MSFQLTIGTRWVTEKLERATSLERSWIWQSSTGTTCGQALASFASAKSILPQTAQGPSAANRRRNARKSKKQEIALRRCGSRGSPSLLRCATHSHAAACRGWNANGNEALFALEIVFHVLRAAFDFEGEVAL